jgi:hypothetical protein
MIMLEKLFLGLENIGLEMVAWKLRYLRCRLTLHEIEDNVPDDQPIYCRYCFFDDWSLGHSIEWETTGWEIAHRLYEKYCPIWLDNWVWDNIDNPPDWWGL